MSGSMLHEFINMYIYIFFFVIESFVEEHRRAFIVVVELISDFFLWVQND